LGNTGLSGVYSFGAAFQAEYEGSIPFTRSSLYQVQEAHASFVSGPAPLRWF
jgi:hypothetical protein